MNEHYSLRTLLRKKIRTCKCSFKQNISVTQHPDLAVCIACNFFIKIDYVSVTKSKVHPEFSQMSKIKLLANKNIHKRLLFSAWMSLFVFFFFIRNLFYVKNGRMVFQLLRWTQTLLQNRWFWTLYSKSLQLRESLPRFIENSQLQRPL